MVPDRVGQLRRVDRVVAMASAAVIIWLVAVVARSHGWRVAGLSVV